MNLYNTRSLQWSDQQISPTCQHGLVVCGYTDGPQNNWMITQYINISRTGVTELLLNATFSAATSSTCTGVCTDSVKIRTFPTNEANEVSRNNTSSYSGNVASLEHIVDEEPAPERNLFQIPMSGSSTGLYLAVVDPSPGTCVGIFRLALFYYICPEQVVNLVEYPETISPTLTSDSDVFLAATCVNNAVLTSVNNKLECSRRGQWKANNAACSCMEGYYLFSDSSCDSRCSEQLIPPSLYSYTNKI